jgi:hypothetical protein
MRPETLHAVLCLQSSIMKGIHLHARSTMLRSIWAYYHIAMLDEALTNASHEDTSTLFVQIFSYWFNNLKKVKEGMLSTFITAQHELM